MEDNSPGRESWDEKWQFHFEVPEARQKRVILLFRYNKSSIHNPLPVVQDCDEIDSGW